MSQSGASCRQKSGWASWMEQGPLSRAMVKEPLKMVDGYVSVPCGPGLGVEVSEETLEKYRVA